MGQSATPDTTRAHLIAKAQARREWDLAVIGGGATGLGRGTRRRGARLLAWCCSKSTTSPRAPGRAPPSWCTAACATWRRATSAWCARRCTSARTLLANAPHLAQRLAFVMPGYHWWERGFYGIGLKMYDALAGSRGLGGTELLSSARDARNCCPRVRRAACAAACKYWDGQFDDARAGASRWRARPWRAARWCSTTARSSALHARGGQGQGRDRARRRDRHRR